jgi:hypothetical protein
LLSISITKTTDKSIKVVSTNVTTYQLSNSGSLFKKAIQDPLVDRGTMRRGAAITFLSYRLSCHGRHRGRGKTPRVRAAVTKGLVGTAAPSIMTTTTTQTSQSARVDTSFRLPNMATTMRCFDRCIEIYQGHGMDTINCSPNLAGGWISTLHRAIGRLFRTIVAN